MVRRRLTRVFIREHVRICSETRSDNRARRAQGPAPRQELQKIVVRAGRGGWRVSGQAHSGSLPGTGRQGKSAILRGPARRVLARSGAGARRGQRVCGGAVGLQSVATQHRCGASAPGVAPEAEPGAGRHRHDPAHARAAAGNETRADRARRRRLGSASPAVVVVQPRLPADRASGLAHARVSAGADHRARGGARDSRLERPAPAAGGRRAMLRVLPPGATRRAADLPRGGSDGPDGRLGAALARCAIHIQRSRQGDHRRFLLDQQLPARLARHIPRQLPHQERGRCAVEGVPAAQGVLHAVAHPRIRRLARLAAQGALHRAIRPAGAGVEGRCRNARHRCRQDRERPGRVPSGASHHSRSR